MKCLSKLILILALSCLLKTVAAQTVNLTGNWTGIANPNGPNFQPTGPQPVSAVITQTVNSMTVTLVFVDGEGVPQVFTGTGQINGTTISSSDNDTVVTGNISSSNGLLQMSGSGKDDTMVQFTGSFSSNGQHMSGTAVSSQGDTVTWSLDKSTTPQVTGLSAVIGDGSVYLRWNPLPVKVDTFRVDIDRCDPGTHALQLCVGDSIIPLRSIFCDTQNVVSVGGAVVQAPPSCLIVSLPDASLTIESGVTYRFGVRAQINGVVQGDPPCPSNSGACVVAVPGGFAGANKPPHPPHPLLFLHGFYGSGDLGGTWQRTVEFMRTNLQWTYGGELYHRKGELDTTRVDRNGLCAPPLGLGDINDCTDNGSVNFSQTPDLFTAGFGNNLANYLTSPDGLAHQGLEVQKFVEKLLADGLNEKIMLVAHSNGGLAARYFLSKISTATEAQARIHSYISYGTPHVGADVPVTVASAEDGARDALFICRGTTIVLSAFLFDLNQTPLPNQIAYTLIDGHSHSNFPELSLAHRGIFDDCHSRHWDGLVPVSSANMTKAPAVVFQNSPTITKIETTHTHIGQGKDFPTILCAIDPNCVMFRAMSPVDIAVIAPDGRFIARNVAAIPAGSYMNIEESPEHETATVLIPFPIGGKYIVRVIPKAGSSPTDTFTITLTQHGTTTVVAQDMPVQDIPPGGLPVEVTSVVPFASFSAKVEIKSGPPSKFELNGACTLGKASSGINPLNQLVTLQVGRFSASIPSGSFVQDKKGRFKFEGVINGSTLEVQIVPLGGNNFELKAEGRNANLTGTVNPVTVGLRIGYDGGSTIVTAELK